MTLERLEAAFLLTAEQIYLLANEDLSWSLSVDEVTRVWRKIYLKVNYQEKCTNAFFYTYNAEHQP
jgi:hypothetical protein